MPEKLRRVRKRRKTSNVPDSTSLLCDENLSAQELSTTQDLKGSGTKHRKRRSSQKKEERKRQIERKTFVIVFLTLFLTALLASAYSYRLLYVNGPKYDELFAVKVGEQYKSKAIVKGLAISPRGMRSSEVILDKHSEKNFIKRFVLNHVSARHNGYGVFGLDWKGSEIFAESGELWLGSTIPESSKSVGFLEFKSLIIDNFYLWTKREKSPFLENVSIAISENYLFIEGGTVKLPLFNESQRLHLLDANVTAEGLVQGDFIVEKGKIPFQGSWNKGYLELEINKVDCGTEVFPDILKPFLKGNVTMADYECSGLLAELTVKSSFKGVGHSIPLPAVKFLTRMLQNESSDEFTETFKVSGEVKKADSEVVTIENFIVKSSLGYSIEIPLINEQAELNIVLHISKNWVPLISRYDNFISLCDKTEEGLSIKLEVAYQNQMFADNLERLLSRADKGKFQENDKKELEAQLKKLLE